MSDKSKSVEPIKSKELRILGVLEKKDVILIILAFAIPLITWSKVIQQMIAGTGLLVNVTDLTYTVQLLLPIFLFAIAAISGSLTTSILISLAATLSYLIVGFPYYWDPTGWPIGEYPPSPGMYYADVTKLLLNVILPGLIGGILTQFGVIRSAKDGIKELVRRPVALILLLIFLGGSILVYRSASAATLSATNPTTFAILLIGVMGITILAAFATRDAFGGLVVGFFLSLVYYSVAAAKDPASEILGVFSIGIVNWVKADGLDPLVQQYYVSYGLGFFIVALWGSIWGVLGKFMIYARPPKDIGEKITEAHIFRDLWSNYFIFGKNTRPEFRLAEEAGTVMEEGAPLTGSLTGALPKGKYVTYRYLDRKRRSESVPASIGGLIIEPTEKDKCRIFERAYKARGQESKTEIGEFLDPKPLYEKYKPMWSPFAFALRENAVKALWPTVILILAVGAILQLGVTIDAYKFLLSGTAGIAAIAIPVAQISIVVFTVAYLYFWTKRIPSALKQHPEGSLSFLFAGVIVAVLFAFSFYMLSALTLVVRDNSIDAFGNFTTSAIIFLLVLTVFTSMSTVQMIGADNINIYFYDDEEKDILPFKHDYDKPAWLRGSHYWVFRSMYIWPFEMTPSLKGFTHEDIERVEMWINADSGKPEWAVSDYHWREIWYRIPDLQEDIAVQVNFTKNFHTPVVSVVRRSQLRAIKFENLSYFQSWLAMFYLFQRGREMKKQMMKPTKVSKKRAETLAKFFIDLPAPINMAAAETMAGFPWNFFRYPKGVASVEKVDGTTKYVYREKNYKPPFMEKIVGGTSEAEMNDGLGSPATVDEDYPQVCPKCGKPLPKSLTCSNCQTDAKNESFLIVL